MKILLAALNAKYIHSCLAIHSLKAYAQKHLANLPAPATDSLLIVTAEYTINQPLDDILQDLCRHQPDILAFSCYIWNIDLTKKLAALFHMVAPQVHIWAGGPEVSYDAEDFLSENDYITGVMIGEGEAVFTELIRAYCMNHDSSDFLSEVPGIAYRSTQDEILTHAAPAPLDMDTLVFPYSDRSGQEHPGSTTSGNSGEHASEQSTSAISGEHASKQSATGSSEKRSSELPAAGRLQKQASSHSICYYESSRGCPFRCSYCLSSLDKKVRFRSLPLVFEDLNYFLDRRVPLVKFVDRTFNCDHARTLAIWNYLKDHDNQVTRFHFEITADLLNDEEIALLSTLRPGLVQLEIGVQSANEETLAAIDRRQDLARLARITGQIRLAGNIHQHLDLIAGLPYEDLESFSHSFDTVYKMEPSQLQLGFLKLLKGSKMHHMKDDYGIAARSWAPYEVVSTRWLSPQDIFLLKGIEKMVETYYNSGQYQMTLTYLMHFVSRPWDFFSRLAAWMEENGYLQMPHNRLTKYNLLRQFAQTLNDHASNQPNLFTGEPMRSSHSQTLSVPDPDALDAILLYDLYLRENVKTRPDWAPDLTSKKSRISAFYADESFRARCLPEIAALPVRQIRHITHIEIFLIDICQTAKTGHTIHKESTLLFRYDKKSPLDASADVQQIRERL